jgi:hypothetical protein
MVLIQERIKTLGFAKLAPLAKPMVVVDDCVWLVHIINDSKALIDCKETINSVFVTGIIQKHEEKANGF